MRLSQLLLLTMLLGVGISISIATELTFDIAGFGNFSNMSQDYGDRVTEATMGNFSYGTEGGFTPNVTVDYGPQGSDPAFWSTGYGTLENILFEDRDRFGILEITFSADPGFEVRLERWDMASYTSAFSQAPTIDKVQVLDGSGTALFDASDIAIPHETFHRFEGAEGEYQAPVIMLRFQSGNLGNLSDDIAFDNIVFSQVAADGGDGGGGEPPVEACGPPVRLTFDPGNERHPVWDPRGDLIAFNTDREPGDWWDIGGVHADGSDERLLAKGPQSGFGLAPYPLGWAGDTGHLVTTENVAFHEYLSFEVTQAPFTRTANDGDDDAFARKLLIDGGGGGGFLKVSRDGSTALWRYSASGGGGRTTIRTAPWSSLSGQSAAAHGTIHVEVNTGQEQRFLQGAALSPDGAFFILAQPAGEGFDLWKYTTDQSAEPEPLTTSGERSGARNLLPDISPDGTRVAFAHVSEVEGSLSDIFILDLDTGSLSNLTDSPTFSESSPSWSPDGRSLGFHRFDHEDSPALLAGELPNINLYTLCLDGDGGGDGGGGGGGEIPPDSGLLADAGNTITYHRLTDFDGDADGGVGQMEISGDGSKIIYATGSKNIYTMNADGTDHRLIFRYADFRGGCPCLTPWVAISHDGDLIAWTDTDDEIFTAHSDGTNQRAIATAVTVGNRVTEPSFAGGKIKFGVDGRLYYQLYQGRTGDSAAASGIFEINSDGTGLRKLFGFPDLWNVVPKDPDQSVDPGEFDVSDDGSRVILDYDLQDPSSFFGPGAFRPGALVTWDNGTFKLLAADKPEMNISVAISGNGEVIAYEYSSEPDLFVNTFDGNSERSIFRVEGFNNFDFRLNVDGSLISADTGGTGSSVLTTLLSTDGTKRLDLMPNNINDTPSYVRMAASGTRLVWFARWKSPASGVYQMWRLDVNPTSLGAGFPRIENPAFDPGYLQQDGSSTTVMSADIPGANEDAWFTGLLDGELRSPTRGGIGRFDFGLHDDGTETDPNAGDGRYHTRDVPAFRTPELGVWSIRMGAQNGAKATVVDVPGLQVIDGEPENLKDTDNDGVSDLLEEAFGGHPTETPPAALPQPTLVKQDDAEHFGVRFNVAEGAVVSPDGELETGDFTLTFEISEDFLSWRLAGVDLVVTVGPAENGQHPVTVRFSESLLESLGSCFLRTVVRRN